MKGIRPYKYLHLHLCRPCVAALFGLFVRTQTLKNKTLTQAKSSVDLQERKTYLKYEQLSGLRQIDPLNLSFHIWKMGTLDQTCEMDMSSASSAAPSTLEFFSKWWPLFLLLFAPSGMVFFSVQYIKISRYKQVGNINT